jgi:GNAT superfamily N-acetyltransferase
MRVIDLAPNQENTYFHCLEEWSDEIKEAGSYKEDWYGKMKNRGLRVKLALDDKEAVGGMIQYAPIEHSFAEGEGLYFIFCIWVHGHKQGRGNYQGKGMGSALIKAAEEDAMHLGGKGLVAWGMSIPVFMRASWFTKHGYRRVDRIGMQELLWKPFAPDAIAPKWFRAKQKPETIRGKVVVTSCISGWCPAQSLVSQRAKRASLAFGNMVEFHEIDTFDRQKIKEWGVSDALFIDDKQIRTGPPPSYEKIRKQIGKRIHRIKNR